MDHRPASLLHVLEYFIMRVSIPRETLDKIKNDYGVSEERATRLYLSAFDDAEAFFGK